MEADSVIDEALKYSFSRLIGIWDRDRTDNFPQSRYKTSGLSTRLVSVQNVIKLSIDIVPHPVSKYYITSAAVSPRSFA